MPALRTRATHPAAVSTAPPPPSLKIISPTPRAFTFPAAHNLSDSPYSSPPNSPFERDLRAHDVSASSASTPSPSVASHHDDEGRPPLSAFTHTLFPVSTATSPSPAPSIAHSTSSSLGTPVEERRPKKGDDDYVKRPENAFILFRRQCCEDISLSFSPSTPPSMPSGSSSAPPPSLTTHTPKKPRQADLSRTISQRWKALSPEERTHWEDLAKEKKRQHEMLHPNYVYRPRRSGAKNRSSATTSTGWATQPRKHSVPPPPQQIEFVLPTPRPHARSASVPPYQAVQVPNVYAQSPSGSSSDAGGDDPAGLMALILQQHGMQNNAGGLGFDYVPTNLNFETLEPSAFLSALFTRLGDTDTDTNAMCSPASSSSAGGSGPSSPYTPAPACTAYHPSVFTSSPGAGADVGVHPSASHPAASYDDIALGLYDAQSGMDYTSYASTWLAASPWAACASASAQGVEQGDFDLARVPGVGLDIAWGLGIGLGDAFPANSGGDAFPAGDSAHFGYEEMYAPDVQGDSASGGGEMAFEDVFSMEA